MKIILCVDDNYGMMFNNRRQSRDRVVIQKIIDLAENSTLWINEYSSSLFEKGCKNLIVDNEFLSKAKTGDYCFIENCSITPYKDRIEEIVIFYWNREYPADMSFDFDLTGWECAESSEFPGHSHEKITMEVLRK